jgi:hypothetical protein
MSYEISFRVIHTLLSIFSKYKREYYESLPIKEKVIPVGNYTKLYKH